VCRNPSPAAGSGAVITLLLNQTAAHSVEVTGWSKARDVTAEADSDYSIYLDATYMDGDHLWGTAEAFDTGTHDWQKRQVLLLPVKPVRELSIYALFRKHAGTVWFDDIQARELTGSGIFDGQAIQAPKLPNGEEGGWFVRDLAAGAELVPLSRVGSLGLKATLNKAKPEVERLTLGSIARHAAGFSRAITVYYCARFKDGDPRWWYSIRRSSPVKVGEAQTAVRTQVGATGSMAAYPFACVTGSKTGLTIGIPPELGPRIARLFFHADGGLLVAAFDVDLVQDNVANPGTAILAVFRGGCDPRWGFRDAARRYYHAFPDAFVRRSKAEGIWMPFTDPSKVSGVKDFGIAYHEGDNSVVSDDKLGILSFRYTEPMTWWMSMNPSVPRTYDDALKVLNQNLHGVNEENRKWAQAVVNSGSLAQDGRNNLVFENQPWTNGAVWVLNPNPRLPLPPGEWNKARLTYTKETADIRYAPGQKLSGEYLDSLEGWSDSLDFSPKSLAYSKAPPTFIRSGLVPVVPQWFSTYEIASFMSEDLRNRGRLLMANATPWRIWSFLPLLDVAGTETNWNPGGQWTPDGDDTFCLRRTLCYHKPYLLLQNTNFNLFTPDMVRRYFARSMAYGVFPSMFSADAATSVYWENPNLYNRDRPMFQRVIPMIQRLSAAGWEPVTNVSSSEPSVYVERFGKSYLTVFNDSSQPRDVVVTPDWKQFGLPAGRLVDAFTGDLVGTGQVRFRLEPEECRVLRMPV